MTVAWPGQAGGVAPSLAGHVTRGADGLATVGLFVDGVRCGACVRRIESALAEDPHVVRARLNLSTRRLDLAWTGPRGMVDSHVARLAAIGHVAVPWLPDDVAEAERVEERQLLLLFGIAAFALANVMMLAWAVWLGHAHDMGPGTRAFFHWLQALIAVPAILWCARPFTSSAWQALGARRTNMDVPIAAGVLLTMLMSLAETVRHGPHVYFDGALALLTVLLLGRWLNSRMRARTRSGVARLASLAASPVRVELPDGQEEAVPAAHVRAGAVVRVAAGEMLGVDATVRTGRSEADTSLVTGEWAPRPVAPGDLLLAGTLNLRSPITAVAVRAGTESTLGEMVRLMEAAEQRRGRHVALADRAVGIYTPLVHALAFLTFLGWLVIGGIGWQLAMVHAVTVLIIACPCALGLAVPAAQVAAAGRLLADGVLLSSETALERASRIDTLVLDKTGTLMLPGAVMTEAPADPAAVSLAAGLAATSIHPLARAIRSLAPDAPALAHVREVPGAGLEWLGPEGKVRLGSAAWCGVTGASSSAGLEAWLAAPGREPCCFALGARERPDAAAVLAGMRGQGVRLVLASGDRAEAVEPVARRLGLGEWHAGLSPAGKVELVGRLQAEGRRVLMVGDGLNDAPALAAADCGIAPGTAADISRRTADAIWMGDCLAPVATFIETARRTSAIVRQNIVFSFVYNAVWVPVAMAGLVTPWVAAAAMAASSLLVTLNAMRLAPAQREPARSGPLLSGAA